MSITSYIPQIKEHFKNQANLVLTAQPGAGKTTTLPPALLSTVPGKIIVLEPRRIAAIAAAQYICQQHNFNLGEEVGYHVRLDKKYGSATRLIFMTEKLFLNYLISDPELSGISMVIFDEFHERSFSTDLVLGALKDLQTLGSSIKILVMSATLETTRLQEFLETKHIEVPGKLFPLEIQYSKKNQNLKIDQQFFDDLKIAFQETRSKSQQDILVFLPGAGEIQRAIQFFQNMNLKDFELFSLYGQMPLAEQKKVLQKSSSGFRRLIFSTNVAESAVTIDGVDAVIDSGLEKASSYDIELGFQQLLLERISLSSATQRAGRSARQKNGFVYKMWTPHDERSMPKNPKNPMYKEDLGYEFLTLSHLKSIFAFFSWKEFSWYETPNKDFLESYFEKLQALHFITKDYDLTPLGKKVVALPFAPEMSLGLLTAYELGIAEAMSFVFHFIENERVQSHPSHQSTDCDLLPSVLNALHGSNVSFSIEKLFKLAHQTFSQLNLTSGQGPDSLGILSSAPHRPMNFSEFSQKVKRQIESAEFADNYKLVLLKTYINHLCRRRFTDPKKALQINGIGVEVKSQVSVKESDFFIILDGQKKSSQQEITAHLISGIDFALIERNYTADFVKKENLVFDEDQNNFYVETNTFFQKLPLKNPSRTRPNEEQKQTLFTDYIKSNFDVLRKKSENLQSLIHRIEFANHHLQNSLKANSQNLGLTPIEFNSDFIESLAADVSYGKKDINEIIDSDWNYFISSLLPQGWRDLLHKEAPSHFTLPTGKVLKIDYSQVERPMVSAKIQEVFGLKETPQLFYKTVPLIFDLLGPNYRSVQITGDLKTFWKTSYLEIRKELRARYPKHSWPEEV